VKKILLAVVIVITGAVLFISSVKVNGYPKLNSCFKTSVSEKLLCSKSSNYVRLEMVSKYFLDAVVMSEDDKFYAHKGFDWKELRKSMEANLRQFSFVRGGSTITQQLVKNIYLSREKTISRKIVEARLAQKIEKNHSKKLILEKYINAIEFGKDIWGIKQAANFYFDKSPAELNPLESLYLVVLLPSPVRYSRTFFDKKLSSYQEKRILSLLRRMKRRKIFSSDQLSHLEAELVKFLKIPNAGSLIPSGEWPDEVDQEEEVVQPEEGEMSGTELDNEVDSESNFEAEKIDADDTSPEKEKADNHAARAEESYSEEETVVEDQAPNLNIEDEAPELGKEDNENID